LAQEVPMPNAVTEPRTARKGKKRCRREALMG
jgi:hypothetical protein